MATKHAEAAATPGTPPTDDELVALLGPAHGALEALVTRASGRTFEWRKYTKASPWVLRVSQGKKPVMYVLPEAGALKATVLLGPRAAAAALAGRVSRTLHAAIRAARVYPEGRPVTVRVTRASDIAHVEELVAVKLKPEAPPTAPAHRTPAASPSAASKSR